MKSTQSPSPLSFRQRTDETSAKDEDWSAIVTVLAGQKKKAFTLYRKVLYENFEFFRKALSGTWKENEANLVTLADIDAMSFKAYVSWIYTHRLDKSIIVFGSDASSLLAEEEITIVDEWASKVLLQPDRIVKSERQEAQCAIIADRLVRLWCHGDFLGDNKFQDAVVDQLCDELSGKFRSHMAMSMATAQFVGESTVPECPLRDLVIEFFNERYVSDEVALKEGAPRWLLAGLLCRSAPKRQKYLASTNFHLLHDLESTPNASSEGEESAENED